MWSWAAGVVLLTVAVADMQNLSICSAFTRSILRISAWQYSSHSVPILIKSSHLHNGVPRLNSLANPLEHNTIITGI